MPTARRRTLLAALAGAAVGGPAALAAGGVTASAANAASAASTGYPGTNTQLYADPAWTEGTHYARRYRRQPAFDDDLTSNAPFPQTAILALHGGGIEMGTSELCLAVAGYHPATLATATDGYPLHDYWMFEGLLSSGNGALHVTSTKCDDPYAVALCAGARYAVSLHGCREDQAGVPDGTRAVLVGGLDSKLRSRLAQEYAAVGIVLAPGQSGADIDGSSPNNIVNRTLTKAGAQLELTTALRDAMFVENTRARRKHTTTQTFWNFVAATRKAVALRAAG